MDITDTVQGFFLYIQAIYVKKGLMDTKQLLRIMDAILSSPTDFLFLIYFKENITILRLGKLICAMEPAKLFRREEGWNNLI